MGISKTAGLLKLFSSMLPRKLMATSFSLKQSTLNIFEAMWNISKHKKPIFRKKLTVEEHSINGVSCEWLYKSPEQKSKVVFYLHGGAYLSGGLSNSRNRSMRYAVNTSASLFVVDYRTSAVAPFPAALEDSYAAYKYLKEIAPDSEIIIIGDSAGGGLALATILKVLENSVNSPSRIILNSPWTDLTCSAETYQTKQEADVVLEGVFLKKCAKLYGNGDYKNPYISPIFADFTGFPPIYINVGTDEILLDDSIKLKEIAQTQGVKVNLNVWDGMFHMFHYWEGFAKESTQVCKEIYKVIDDN